MKKKIGVIIIAVLLTCGALGAHAETHNLAISPALVANMSGEQRQVRVAEISARVQQIKAVDRSALSRAERKALRVELKGLHREEQALNSGRVFVSAGGLVIIVLVLILIV